MNIVSRILDNGNLEITVPVVMRCMAGRKRIIAPDKPEGNETLMLALARGLRWQSFIDEGKFANIKELAAAVGQDTSQIARAIRLTRLSPTIIHRIVTGDVPAGLTQAKLRGLLPTRWWEQEAILLKEE